MSAPVDRDILRKVEIEPLAGRKWRLTTWDIGCLDSRGQSYIGYELVSPEGTVLFTGDDFAGSPMHADDSDATLRALLGFLTLRPGDTDREYFDKYTAAQMEFAQSYECESMGLWALDEGSDEFPLPEFVNLEDES